MGFARKALVYTLLAHALVLSTLVAIPVSEGVPASEQFAEIEFVDAREVVRDAQSYEEDLRARLNARVANLRADANARSSNEARSTSSDLRSEADLTRQVEAELRALEEAEFDRLSGEQKDVQTAGTTRVQRHEVGDTFEAWDAQYDGLVTVRYALSGRKGQDLDVPGYTCLGGARVEVAISVDRTGRVVGAELVEGDPESCFGKAALRSAREALFSPSPEAPKRQQGTLTYVFVAQ
jgi:TonB family protein